MLKGWDGNIDPIVINIEVYSLRRFNGSIGDEYDLIIRL